jgi:5-methylcytosine-specific restriction protein A
MSQFWKGPARNDPQYKRARRFVLARDQYRCQIRGPRCQGRATQAHHIDGVTAANLCDVTRMQAACGPCNAHVGRPKSDPAPRVNAWW